MQAMEGVEEMTGVTVRAAMETPNSPGVETLLLRLSGTPPVAYIRTKIKVSPTHAVAGLSINTDTYNSLTTQQVTSQLTCRVERPLGQYEPPGRKNLEQCEPPGRTGGNVNHQVERTFGNVNHQIERTWVSVTCWTFMSEEPCRTRIVSLDRMRFGSQFSITVLDDTS